MSRVGAAVGGFFQEREAGDGEVPDGLDVEGKELVPAVLFVKGFEVPSPRDAVWG